MVLCMFKYTFYFGTARKNGPDVSAMEFDIFCEKHITPLFPGYTVTVSHGYWEGKKELTFIVTIICDMWLESYKLAKEYCKLFNQSEVLVTCENDVMCRFVTAPLQEELELVTQ